MGTQVHLLHVFPTFGHFDVPHELYPVLRNDVLEGVFGVVPNETFGSARIRHCGVLFGYVVLALFGRGRDARSLCRRVPTDDFE